MENFKSFKGAKAHFLGEWAAERRRIIADLTSIKNEIQRQERIHSNASIAYSCVGLVGKGLAIAEIVAAPFTFGVPLPLSVVGNAVGVVSGIHEVVKIGIIKRKCYEAKTSLENHRILSVKMAGLIAELREEIDEPEMGIKEEYEFEISHLWNSVKCIKSVASSVKCIKSVASSVIGISKLVDRSGNAGEIARSFNPSNVWVDVQSAVMDIVRHPYFVTAFGIITDLRSLISNAVSLLEKEKLCKESQKLEEVIKILQKEYDDLSKFFIKK